MPLCFVFGCNHQPPRETCSFFRFQKNCALKWEKLCRRKDKSLNITYDRICSCHFKDGDKASGPTLFPWNKGKYFDFACPTPRTNRKKVMTPSGLGEEEPCSSDISGTEGEVAAVPPSPVPEASDHGDYCMTFAALAKSNQDLKAQVKQLEASLRSVCLNAKRPFSLRDIVDDEKKMLLYTSLKPDMFKIVDKTLQRFPLTYVEGWTPGYISRTDQLLLTLMKLTMNTPLLDLAERFATSTTTVNNIFLTHVYALHEVFYEGMVEKHIPSLNKCKGSMPSSFGDFSSCRLVIDATEIHQDVPGQSLSLQAQTYSSYKTNHTVKSVTGVAPNGAIVYVSKLYPGSTSDVAIVQHSRMLDAMIPGDMILADKGFTIHKLLPPGVLLNIPPFLTGKSQYTKAEVAFCRKIARSRIHVERANERIKNYAILDHIPQQHRYLSTRIFQVCCTLVNFQDPLLQEIAQNYDVSCSEVTGDSNM